MSNMVKWKAEYLVGIFKIDEQRSAIPVYQHAKLLMTKASFLRMNYDLSSLDISKYTLTY